MLIKLKGIDAMEIVLGPIEHHGGIIIVNAAESGEVSRHVFSDTFRNGSGEDALRVTQ
jgi:hypothetical protein